MLWFFSGHVEGVAAIYLLIAGGLPLTGTGVCEMSAGVGWGREWQRRWTGRKRGREGSAEVLRRCTGSRGVVSGDCWSRVTGASWDGGHCGAWF